MHPKLNRFFAKLAVFLTVWTAFFGSTAVNAAEIQYVSDTMSRLKISQTSNHSITFKAPAAWGTSTAYTFSFSTTTGAQTSNFAFVSDMSPTRDIDISTGTAAGTSGPLECADSTNGGSVTYNATSSPVALTASATEWGVASSTVSTNPTITITSPGTTASGIASGNCVRVRVGSAVTGGVLAVTNPSAATASSTQYLLSLSTAGYNGQAALGIVANDQPTVAATNTPSMTFELGVLSITCDDSTAVGSMTSGALNFYDLRADYIEPTSNHLCTRVSSNATNGVAVQIKSAYGQMTSTRAGVYFPASAVTTGASSTVRISNAAGLNTTLERYGACVKTKGAGAAAPTSEQPLITVGYNQGGTTADATLCASTQNQILDSSTNVMRTLGTSFDTVWSTTGETYKAYADMYLKAAVTVNTPATNSYSDTLTVIAFATF
ncbi:MAG: hypothetical protein Q7S47_01605 [bacterium]|nr:hypothetical protein [bacterium]